MTSTAPSLGVLPLTKRTGLLYELAKIEKDQYQYKFSISISISILLTLTDDTSIFKMKAIVITPTIKGTVREKLFRSSASNIIH